MQLEANGLGSSGNILIVDDNKNNIEVLCNALEPEGYNLIVAQSGEEALELVSKILPDLILLDVMMGGIDGFETCKRIKGQEKLKDIPIIFITAKNENEDVIKGFSAGAVDYIQKPFDFSEVIARVKTHFTNYALQKEMNELLSAMEIQSVELRIARDKALKAHEKLEKAQNALMKAERMSSLGRMIAAVALEIDNPCNFVVNNMNTALKSAESLSTILDQVIPSDEEGKRLHNVLNPHFSKLNESMELSREGAQRITATVRNLRDLTNEDLGLAKPFKIDEIVYNVIGNLKLLYKNIKIESYIEKDIVAFVNDKKIEQAISHILDYCLQSTLLSQKDPSLKIYLKKNGNSLTLTIEDTAPALNSEDLRGLFEPLYQSKRIHRDTSMSLSVANNILSHYKGDIIIASSKKGTSTTLHLPLFNEESAA